jgi:hypothetical protein
MTRLCVRPCRCVWCPGRVARKAFSHYAPSHTITAAAPAVGDHPLAYAAPHAYHQMRCGATNARTKTHNALMTTLANALAPLGWHVDLANHLHSSDTARTQVDGLFTSDRHPRPKAVDASLSCPLLPSHLPAAIASALAIFLARAAEKMGKHADGCALLHRDFLPFILTTLGGVGPPAFVEWLREEFHLAALAAASAGGSRHDAIYAYSCLLQTIQAVIARGNCSAVARHTADA